MNKVIIILFFLSIFVSCRITKNTYFSKNNITLSKNAMLEKLKLYYWKRKVDTSEYDIDTLFYFQFNKNSKKKGAILEYVFYNNNRKLISKKKFEIIKYKNNSIIMKIQDNVKMKKTKLYFLSWLDISLDGIKYNYVILE